MCRCAERRGEIARAASAALGGDLSRIVPATRFVAVTSAEDVALAFKAALVVIRGR